MAINKYQKYLKHMENNKAKAVKALERARSYKSELEKQGYVFRSDYLSNYDWVSKERITDKTLKEIKKQLSKTRINYYARQTVGGETFSKSQATVKNPKYQLIEKVNEINAGLEYVKETFLDEKGGVKKDTKLPGGRRNQSYILQTIIKMQMDFGDRVANREYDVGDLVSNNLLNEIKLDPEAMLKNIKDLDTDEIEYWNDDLQHVLDNFIAKNEDSVAKYRKEVGQKSFVSNISNLGLDTDKAIKLYEILDDSAIWEICTNAAYIDSTQAQMYHNIIVEEVYNKDFSNKKIAELNVLMNQDNVGVPQVLEFIRRTLNEI